ncbi:MAG: hypothetical protein GXX01_06600 [Clostridiales bacterium]|nr:hypothetical protein [Clostridiales bacterium]
MSSRIIKHNQVDIAGSSLEIPVVPIESEKESEKPAGDGQAAEETIRLNEELQELINRAEKQAENIIRQAHEEADSIRRQAREEGYQAGLKEGKRTGYREGYEEAVKETEELKEKAKALLESAHRESREYISRTKAEIIRLAAAMARKIIHFNIDMNDEAIVEMVKEALHRSEEKKQVLLRSPAEFVSVLKANMDQFEKICPHANFIVLEDATVESPGCVIETEDQVINLEVDQQLNNIIEALSAMVK